MKTIFVLIDCLAIVDIVFTVRALRNNTKASYGLWLSHALEMAIVAIAANIMVALSITPVFAGVAYCLYFASINWIIYFLVGFCLFYTENSLAKKRIFGSPLYIMALDTISLMLNPYFHHEFEIIEITGFDGSLFYQTQGKVPYFIHLAIDYFALVVSLYLIIKRLIKTYNIYRTKYIIILSVLIFVVVLNIVYMMFTLPLDISVVFYGVGGTLIYIAIQNLVPKSLMMSSLARATDDMNEGLILFDISDNCIYANAFAAKRFTIDPSTFNLECDPCAYVINNLKERGCKYGTVDLSRHLYDENDENLRIYTIRYNCLNDNKGRIIGSYFLIEDNTEQARYLNEIQEARDLADTANQAKSTFLANMSHEIRTPLNSVLGMNEMIMRSTEDPVLLEYARNIKASGDTLLGLISDILDFSKIEANKMDVVPKNYHPHNLIRECVNSFEQAAEEKDLYIVVKCEEDLPKGLFGDQKLLKQIISNIISNAIKYTREGGITVSISNDRINAETVSLVISVADTGIGIAPEDQDGLFDAFSRVNEGENASVQGTGLGLAITKEIVNLLKGHLFLVSRPGAGSTFTVEIPQKVTDPAPAGVFERHVQVEEKKYRESFTAEDACVLVVDDAKLNIKVIQGLLKKTRLQIDTVTDGNEAIRICMDKKYDVILLDHRMPDPDGIKVFEVISKEGANTATPVIMLTANVVSGAEEEYKKMGFADYLSKPVHGEDLEAVLVKYLPPEKVILN